MRSAMTGRATGAGAGNDEERAVAVADGAALGVVELEGVGFEREDVEKRGIHVIRLAEIGAKRKRRRGGTVNACEKSCVFAPLLDQRENFFADVVEPDGLGLGAVVKILFDYFSDVGAEVFPGVALRREILVVESASYPPLVSLVTSKTTSLITGSSLMGPLLATSSAAVWARR